MENIQGQVKKEMRYQKILVSYANDVFKPSQKKNTESALSVGGFDHVFAFGPKDLDKDFRKKNAEVLSQHRGNGYWLWKPYVINKVLAGMGEGDYLFYCDAGAFFIDNIQHLIDFSQRIKQDVIPFELGFLEKHWTKRDVFIALECDKDAFSETFQRLASFVLIRKSSDAMAFVSEWLASSQIPGLIDDSPNVKGLPNDKDFKEHRHDQSIYSLLTKKHGFRGFRDPSQWGNHVKERYPEATYPQILEHTRKRNITLYIRIRRKLKKILKGVFGLK